MRSHGATVNLGASSRGAYALRNVEDDAREAILIDPDFLIVGDLAQLADIGELFGKITYDRAAKERRVSELGHFGRSLSVYADVCDGAIGTELELTKLSEVC